MTDDEFLRAFFGLTLPHSEFHHRDHVRLTWLVIHRLGEDTAAQVVAEGIRSYAAAQGHGDRYHETIMRFWVCLVGHAIRDGAAAAGDFDAFVAAYPLLLDPKLPLRHWSREALFSAEARGAWRDADVLALPF